MFFLSCLLLFVDNSFGVTLDGIGTNTFWPVLRHWGNAYRSIDSTFSMNFTFESAFESIDTMTEMHSLDFAMIDFLKLTPAQYDLGYRAFPLLQTTLVPQINLPGIPNLILDRNVLPLIYMGNITNWNDSAIVATNPYVSLPNATIQVYYRDGMSSFNHLWSSGLSAWSEEWNSTYGVDYTFPSDLRALPNFIPLSNVLFINGAVSVVNYSIGYVPYFLVKRDPSLTYAQLIHKWTTKPVVPDQLNRGQAENWVPLNERLEGAYHIDGIEPEAWPIASYIYILLDVTPTDCKQARDLYKFFHWSLINPIAREATTFLGCLTLAPNISTTVLKEMAGLRCNGEAIGLFEKSEEKGALDLAFLLLSILTLVGGSLLSGLHIYHFSKTHINLVYSLVFVVGTVLTLLSPVFWYIEPTDAVCGARIWTESIGFAILLATMFSRTWQLNDIYKLQKENMDTLRSKKTARNTLVQLAITLVGVITANFFILLIWASVDPLTSTWVTVDEYRLTGYYTCAGNHTIVWLILELIFFLSLLCFGIYVIYNTWSFQRQALLTETRWVLVALYNIIMNLAAIVPLLSFLNVTENTLSLIIIISTDISGGSIICAVLLPRLVSKLELTQSSKNSKNKTNQPMMTKTTKQQQKREYSKTPEEELSRRLQEPLPLRLGPLTERAEKGDLELQPIIRTREHETDTLEISSSHQLLEGAFISRNFSPSIAEEETSLAILPEKEQSVKQKTPGDALTWTKNPIKVGISPKGESRQLDDSGIS